MRLVVFAVLIGCQQGLPQQPPPPPPAPRTPLADRLVALGQEKMKELQVRREAERACPPLDADRERALRAQVTAWVEHAVAWTPAKGELEITFGCGDGSAMLADVHVDVAATSRTSHWWVLRISDRITPLVAATGADTEDWSEGVTETSVATLAELDLDHDGQPDAVMETVSHEGGAVHSDYQLHAWLSASRRVVRIAKLDYVQMWLPLGHTNGSPLVFAIKADNKDAAYKCADLDRLVDCPEAVKGQRADAAFEAAQQLEMVRADHLPDRAQLSAWLRALEVSDQVRTSLLAEI